MNQGATHFEIQSNDSSPTQSPPTGDEDTEKRNGTGFEKKAGRRKINIEFINEKSRRHITFSKRKTGIMKKAFELSTLTGTQVLLLVASETGHVYTFATPKLQPLITKPEGKQLIQTCLNAPDTPAIGARPDTSTSSSSSSSSSTTSSTTTTTNSNGNSYYPPDIDGSNGSYSNEEKKIKGIHMMEDHDFKLPDGIKDPATEFEMLESLGRGSFGAVFKAKHKKTGHIVAIKQVPVNEDFQEILKEINIMKQCRSKYVVQYYGNYFKGETCWIIMEYCAMGSVSDMMNITNKILNEEQIALVCYSTLKGLYYLHKNSKIHRDIKPGNILVTASGECKLAVIGTPFFLAPEVIQEVGYDSKADIWALGISAIEMAEFNPPYHDLHPMRVLFMIPTSESPKLKDKDKWSPEFSDFIKLCLAKEQSQRPSAKDLLKHPFFEKKVKGTFVMKSLSDSAQTVIDQAGGREQAIKDASERKARNQRASLPPLQHGSEPMNELDSLLNGIILSNNTSGSKRLSGGGASHVAPETSPAQPSLNFSRQLSNNSFLQTTPNVPSQTTAQPKPPASELDDLLEEMLNPSFGTKQRGLTPLSSPTSRRAAPVVPPQVTVTRVSGVWAGRTAGGCANAHSWRNNPQFLLNITQSTTLRIALRQTGDRLVHIGFYFARAMNDPNKRLITLARDLLVPGVDITFLRNTEVSTKVTIEPGTYIIIPATFEPHQEGTFELEVAPSEVGTTLRLAEIAPDRDWRSVQASFEWRGDTAGGSFSGSSATWKDNPKFLFEIGSTATVTIILGKEADVAKDIYIGFYIFRAVDKNMPYVNLTAANLISKTNFLNGNEVLHSQSLAPGAYIVVPCTFDSRQEGGFSIMAYSESPLSMIDLKDQVITMRGEWRGVSAGGCLNHTSWRTNPQFQLTNTGSLPTKLTIIMDQLAKDSNLLQFAGFYVARSTPSSDKKVYTLTPKDVIGNTEFINDFQVYYSVVLEPQSSCIVIPCTFTPNIESLFALRVVSSQPTLSAVALPDWGVKRLDGEWRGATCGGRYSNTSSSWTQNPRFALNLPRGGRYTIILNQSDKSTNHGIGFYYFKTFADGSLKELVCKSGFVSGKEVVIEGVAADAIMGTVLPSTFEAGIQDSFSLTVYCERDYDFITTSSNQLAST
eukprot:gene7449-8715_t